MKLTSDILFGRVMITEYPLSNVFSNYRICNDHRIHYLYSASHGKTNAYRHKVSLRTLGAAVQALTGISGSWLDDDRLARDKLALLLGSLYHTLSNSVLNRAPRRHIFDLPHCPQLSITCLPQLIGILTKVTAQTLMSRNSVESNERSIAYSIKSGV